MRKAVSRDASRRAGIGPRRAFLDVWPDCEPTASTFITTSMPSITRPNTTWRPSSHEVLTVVMKNWEPFESGPELAIDRMPSLVCFSLKFSSARTQGE